MTSRHWGRAVGHGRSELGQGPHLSDVHCTRYDTLRKYFKIIHICYFLYISKQIIYPNFYSYFFKWDKSVNLSSFLSGGCWLVLELGGGTKSEGRSSWSEVDRPEVTGSNEEVRRSEVKGRSEDGCSTPPLISINDTIICPLILCPQRISF